MGVGLWLAEPAAKFAVSAGIAASELAAVSGGRIAELKDWLASQKLIPFTMNGFPQGNFHQAIVKHRVYQPTWWEDDRRAYTELLIKILDQLLPEGVPGSISTLPIAWGSPKPTHDQLRRAADNLCKIADHLDRLYQETGRCIVLAIEPEPGCYLTDNATMRDFFRHYLLNDDSQSDKRRRHLTVCHDICHAAVMREDQAVEFAKHHAEGIRIGKVQVSSAIDIDWDSINEESKSATFEQLKNFAEDRYLHQTTIQLDHNPAVLHEDLPELLSSISAPNALRGSWRVHFHVPIFYDSNADADQARPPNPGLGIGTTQKEILRCIKLLEEKRFVLEAKQETAIGSELVTGQGLSSQSFLNDFFTGHYEVETYAWTVLPPMLRQDNSLVEDIRRELTYFKGLFSESR